MNKIDANSINMLELLSENDVTALVGESVASLMLNPAVVWAKFILTDDLPNGNGDRVPVEEFDNIIKTGIYMPVKMAEGRIAEGHEDSKPIGVITHLKKEIADFGSRVVALAALWGVERPADVEYIRSAMEETGEVNVSWELAFGDRTLESGGIRALRDIVLRAVTLVLNPAYRGRTKFLAIAAEATPWSPAYINDLPDSSFLYIAEGGELDSEGKTTPRELRKFAVKDATGLVEPTRLSTALAELEDSEISGKIKKGVKSTINAMLSELNSGKSAYFVSFGQEQSENNNTEDELETLEQLKAELKSKEDELATALANLSEKTKELTAISEELTTTKQEKEVLDEEVFGLREFKNEIEESKLREEKLSSIKQKFIDNGIDKDEEFFKENAETLLKMNDEEFEFMVQELASFAKLTEASLNSRKQIPNIKTYGTESPVSVKELAKALKEKRAK